MPDPKEMPFPNWREPATKGDVITAMIWTRSLVTKAVQVATAASTGSEVEVAKAVDLYEEEWKEFTSVLDKMAGRETSS